MKTRIVRPSAAKAVGVLEAKTRLPALLRRVAAGERFHITRHGRVMAELSSPTAGPKRDAEAALARIARRAARHRLGRLRVRALIEAGRRF
jgi:antitoxin (DNA-binding transcriptional repressor) of toxin-antitoxin stability system